MMTDNTEEAEIRLVDFGLSKILGPNGVITESYGTLGYASPEVLLKKPHGKETDCWALGVIAYLLLCGQQPFYSINDKEVIRQTIHEEPDFSSEAWANISVSAFYVCRGLL